MAAEQSPVDASVHRPTEYFETAVRHHPASGWRVSRQTPARASSAAATTARATPTADRAIGSDAPIVQAAGMAINTIGTPVMKSPTRSQSEEITRRPAL